MLAEGSREEKGEGGEGRRLTSSAPPWTGFPRGQVIRHGHPQQGFDKYWMRHAKLGTVILLLPDGEEQLTGFERNVLSVPVRGQGSLRLGTFSYICVTFEALVGRRKGGISAGSMVTGEWVGSEELMTHVSPAVIMQSLLGGQGRGTSYQEITSSTKHISLIDQATL